MDYQARAQAIHQRAMVVDSHHDFALCVFKSRLQGTYDSVREYWIPQFRAAGMKIQSVPIAIDSTYLPEMALRRTIQILDAMYTEIEENADSIEVARSYADIERINAAGKIAALLAFEGGEALGNDLSALRMFYKLGIRMISFTWMRRTALGDGTWENGTGGGLTRFGVATLKEMNRLGIVMDVSHSSDPTFWSVIETASQPVVNTHTCCRALVDHPRNLTDEMLRALAATGGVAGITAVPAFVGGAMDLERYVDHIEHAANVAGIDHVGIGSDFCKLLGEMHGWQGIDEERPGPRVKLPPAIDRLAHAEDLPGITVELLRRGWNEPDIEKVLGRNFARVFKQVLR